MGVNVGIGTGTDGWGIGVGIGVFCCFPAAEAGDGRKFGGEATGVESPMGGSTMRQSGGRDRGEAEEKD